MTPSTLVIFGASARAAAQSAVRAGCRVWAADLFADADLRACAEARRVENYPCGFLRLIDDAPGDAWMYTGALENHPGLLDRMARSRRLLGCPGTVVRRVRDPRQLADAVRSLGFHFPEIRGDDFPAHEEGVWLCKPFRSAGGARVRMAKPSDNRGRRGRTSYFQRRIEGLPASAVFVGDGKGSFLVGASRQLIGCSWCGARGFQYCGSIGPLAFDEHRRDELDRLGSGLAGRFGLVGLFGIDLLLAADRLWVLEVNPRYTASVEVLERALDISAIAWHVAACRGEGLPSPSHNDSTITVGKTILFAPHTLTVATADCERWLAESLHSPATLADVPVAGARIEGGQPLFTVFAQGADVADVEQRLAGIAAEGLAAYQGTKDHA